MTPSEKKAREKEARDLASFLRTVIEAGGLESVGVASACVEKVASALDAAERRGFERARNLAINWFAKNGYEALKMNIENLKYEDSHDSL